MSPSSNRGLREFSQRTGLFRRLVLLAVLWNSSDVFGQARSAMPETARPIRKLDTATPVTLADTLPVAALPGSSPIELEKTPIRRLGDSDSAGAVRPRSQLTVWFVLGGILAAAGGVSLWARRRPGATHWKLPGTVFQVLGRSAVNGNQSVTLMRLGERVLLVSSSGTGMQTLAVVTDPAEVAAMTAECLSNRKLQLGRSIEQPTRRPREGRVSEQDVVSQPVAGVIGADSQGSRTVRRAAREVENA